MSGAGDILHINKLNPCSKPRGIACTYYIAVDLAKENHSSSRHTERILEVTEDYLVSK